MKHSAHTLCVLMIDDFFMTLIYNTGKDGRDGQDGRAGAKVNFFFFFFLLLLMLIELSFLPFFFSFIRETKVK